MQGLPYFKFSKAKINLKARILENLRKRLKRIWKTLKSKEWGETFLLKPGIQRKTTENCESNGNY